MTYEALDAGVPVFGGEIVLSSAYRDAESKQPDSTIIDLLHFIIVSQYRYASDVIFFMRPLACYSTTKFKKAVIAGKNSTRSVNN